MAPHLLLDLGGQSMSSLTMGIDLASQACDPPRDRRVPRLLTGHVYPCFASWGMDKRDEGPYLEVKMPERFLLQFRLDDKRE